MATPRFRRLRKMFKGLGFKKETHDPAEIAQKALGLGVPAAPVEAPSAPEAPEVSPVVETALRRLEAGDDDLTDNFSRAELEEVAEHFGVEDPHGLPNKAAISEAIVSAHRG